jgi:glutamine synthetase
MDRQPEALEGADVVRIGFSDLHGVARAKDVPIDAFADVREHGIGCTEAIMTTGLRHNVVAGWEHGFRDLAVVPDLATACRIPWEPGVAWCLADYHDPLAGGPYAADPRGLVRRLCAAWAERGYEPVVAPELEFYVLDAPEGRAYVERDSSVYTAGAASDPRGILLVGPTTAAQEFGRAQYEINLRHGPALDAADRAFRFKSVVKDVAARQGLHATFMGKPRQDDEGSGFHLHVSLRRAADGQNAFHDEAAPDGLADMARAFGAGVLVHMPALCALANPTVNAYRRFEPDSLAPTHVNWGHDNKLALLRLPGERGEGTRWELRSGDASANPYLLIAGALAAGLLGVREGLALPDPVAGNPYDLAPELLGARLPGSLAQALDALEGDEPLRELLGARAVECFLLVKRDEVRRFEEHQSRVSTWEQQEYGRLL